MRSTTAGTSSGSRETGTRTRPRPRAHARCAAMVVVLALLGLLGLAGAPSAAASSQCRLSDFRTADGSLDTTSYLACFLSDPPHDPPPTLEGDVHGDVLGTLPVTGSDSAQLLGLAAILVVLGVAATVGSRRLRSASADPSRPEPADD
jgi:LPXTG-motif cell wall-anchored protein